MRLYLLVNVFLLTAVLFVNMKLANIIYPDGSTVTSDVYVALYLVIVVVQLIIFLVVEGLMKVKMVHNLTYFMVAITSYLGLQFFMVWGV